MSNRGVLYLAGLLCMGLIAISGCGASPTTSGSGSGGGSVSGSTLTITNVNPFTSNTTTNVSGIIRPHDLANLQLVMKVSSIQVSTTGSSYVTLVSSPIDVDMFASSVLSGSGQTISLSDIPAGTYKFAKLSVASLTIKANVGDKKLELDLLPLLAYQGVDLSSVTFSHSGSPRLVPFTASGKAVKMKMNFFFPMAGISNSGADTVGASSTPTMAITVDDDVVAADSNGTLNVTVDGVSSASNEVLVGVFVGDINSSDGPFTGGKATQGSGGKATISFKLPPGSYTVGAFENMNGNSADLNSGPDDPDRVFFGAGAKIGSKGPELPSITIAAGAASSTTLSFIGTMTQLMAGGADGSSIGSVKSGKGSAKIKIGSSSSTITMGSKGRVYVFGQKASSKSGTPPELINIYNTGAGTLDTSKTYYLTGVPDGKWVVGVFVDADGSGGPPRPGGTDYLGFVGSGGPTSEQTFAGAELDLTNKTITLMSDWQEH